MSAIRLATTHMDVNIHEQKRSSTLNHRESGKSLAKAIASSSPLLACDLF